ncbi:MAG: DUF1833 family protein [Acinetobacter sp.]
MQISENMLNVLDQSKGPMGLIECVEISHPNWPNVQRFVTNSNLNITVKHEDGQAHEYLFSPLTISKSAENGNLDSGLSVKIGDVGEVIPDLIDLIIEDEDITLPKVSYRAYFIGQYDAPIAVSRDLDLESVTRDIKGSEIEAVAPGLNDNGNGEVYSASTDPSLVSFY